MNVPILSTPRLLMPPWTEADIDRLHALWTDAGVRRYLWDDVVISRERAAEMVLQSIASADQFGIGMWCILPRGSGEVIGFCGFRFIEDTSDVEILYGLLPAWWGRGLAMEACRAALDYGFEASLFDRLFGRTDTPNVASVRLLERLGMKLEAQTMIGDLPTLTYSMAKPSANGRTSSAL